MKTLYISAALIALAVSGALSAASAADMSFERAVNADGEPQNWLLHHKNYQGHRFSALKEVNVDTVGKLRLAFTVGLGGLQAGGRHPQGNLEATPLVDDGMMYIADGWGSVYAIDVSSGKKGEIKWKLSSIQASTAPGRATSRAAASTIAVLRSGRTRSSQSPLTGASSR